VWGQFSKAFGFCAEHKPQVNRRALQKQELEEEEEVVIISSCPLRDRDLASGAADIGWLPSSKSFGLKEYLLEAKNNYDESVSGRYSDRQNGNDSKTSSSKCERGTFAGSSFFLYHHHTL
jgi:hypothetical protein